MAEPARLPADARVAIRALAAVRQIALRGDAGQPEFAARVREATGLDLPTAPNTTSMAGDAVALWLGPDEWLLVGAVADAADLARRLAGLHAAAIDVSAGRAVIEVAGEAARAVLEKGCPLDLHPRAFAPERCAQTLLARVPVVLHRTGATPPAWRVFVRPSLAGWLAAWLADAAASPAA